MTLAPLASGRCACHKNNPELFFQRRGNEKSSGLFLAQHPPSAEAPQEVGG